MDSVGSLQGASSTQEKVGEKGGLCKQELGEGMERNEGREENLLWSDCKCWIADSSSWLGNRFEY